METYIVIIGFLALLGIIGSIIKNVIQHQEIDVNIASVITLILCAFALSFNGVAWIIGGIYILFLFIKILNY